MKKVLLSVVIIALSCIKMMAEGLTATLQQGETMTAFYGVNAFKDAYAAAEDGAVITLSEGKFNDVTNIEKSITVIGNMAFDVEGYKKTFLSYTYVQADNVTLEGINFTSSVYLTEINNCHIKKCRIDNGLEISKGTTHTNTLIDQCVINYDNAISTSKNYCIKNSTIKYFSASNPSTNVAYITNCYICYFFRNGSGHGFYQPYAIYKNCVLGIDFYTTNYGNNFDLYSPSEFHNNYFYKTTGSGSYTDRCCTYSFANGCLNSGNSTSEGNTSTWVNEAANFTYQYKTASFDKLGDDGTPVGITGGSGFSPYPSIPRIVSKEIDSRTDAQGKLNVKITVSTEETLVKEETSKEDDTTDESTTE